MANDDTRQTIRGYVSDMLSLERHILEPIGHQVNDENVGAYPYAAQLVRSINSTVESHVSALGAALESLGGHGTHPIKEAWSAFTGAAASAVNAARTNPVSRGLRDDYTALSLATAGYTLLHATSLALGDTATARLAERHLKDYTPLVMQISAVLPQIGIDELRAEGVDVDPTVTGESVARTHEAWRTGSAPAPVR
jgi:hypothetical protein